MKLFRRAIVVLRPEIEEDRFAEGEGPVLGCFGLSARGPCRLIVVEGVHRWEERVDMTGELLRVRAIRRWHPSQGIVAVVPDSLARGIGTGLIG